MLNKGAPQKNYDGDLYNEHVNPSFINFIYYIFDIMNDLIE